LYALSKLNLPELLVKAVFELRSACIAGYFPDLHGCANCGNLSPDRFDISAGQLECDKCRNPYSDGLRMPVNPGALEAMRYICTCDPKQLFAFQVGEDTVRCLSKLNEAYLSTQLERGFSTLDFYKTLTIEI
jgi:DNA repair protein RecO (recombination protein O)